MLLWEDNNLVRRGLSEAPAVSPEKLQKETLSREVSQESDRETQRWNRAEAEMPFEDLQPLCWVLFTRPAGEPGGNHQTNFEWRASRTECAAAEETARYRAMVFLRMVPLGEVEGGGVVGPEDHSFQPQGTGFSSPWRGKWLSCSVVFCSLVPHCSVCVLGWDRESWALGKGDLGWARHHICCLHSEGAASEKVTQQAAGSWARASAASGFSVTDGKILSFLSRCLSALGGSFTALKIK